MRYWWSRLREWYRGRAFRKFYHVKGFTDGTEYIEFYKGVATCVSEYGDRTKNFMSLKFLERMVKDGWYEEKT